MLEDCEASNAKIVGSLNTTLDKLNTTGLSTQHVEWLKGNTTSNVISGLQKCELETFLTDVRADLDSFSMLFGFMCCIHDCQHLTTNCIQNCQLFSKDCVDLYTKAFERFAIEIKTSITRSKNRKCKATHNSSSIAYMQAGVARLGPSRKNYRKAMLS